MSSPSSVVDESTRVFLEVIRVYKCQEKRRRTANYNMIVNCAAVLRYSRTIPKVQAVSRDKVRIRDVRYEESTSSR